MIHLRPPGVPDLIIRHRDPGRHSRGKQTMFCHILWLFFSATSGSWSHWPVNVCTVPSKLASCALPKCIWFIVLHLFSLRFFLLVTQHSHTSLFLPESDDWHGVCESLWSRKVILCWFLVIVKEEIRDYSGRWLGATSPSFSCASLLS